MGVVCYTPARLLHSGYLRATPWGDAHVDVAEQRTLSRGCGDGDLCMATATVLLHRYFLLALAPLYCDHFCALQA